MYAVFGATGHTGSVLARTLLERDRALRVIVRDAAKGDAWRARGAQVAVADLEDERALTEALAGVEGAYLLSPPDARASDFVSSRRRTLEKLARVVAAARVPHVVLLSSIGAHIDSGTGPIVTVRAAEQLLAPVTALTALRAGYFLENWGAVLPMARQDGVLPSFIPAETRVPTVAVEDIGRTAAALLEDGPHGQRIVELAGPTDPTPLEIAATAGELTGREVRLQVAPPEAAVGAFQQFGFSEAMSRLYAEMYQAIASGRLTWQASGTERRRGTVGLRDGLARML